MDVSGKVILLHEFYEHREQKVKELKYYEDQLEELQYRLAMLRAEVSLTSRIIKMIREETVHIVSSVIKAKKR